MLDEITVNKPFKYDKAYGEVHSHDEWKKAEREPTSYLVNIPKNKIIAAFTGFNITSWAKKAEENNNDLILASKSAITNPPAYLQTPHIEIDDPNSWEPKSVAMSLIGKYFKLDEITVNRPLAFRPGETILYYDQKLTLSTNLDKLYKKDDEGNDRYLIDDPETGQRFYGYSKHMKRIKSTNEITVNKPQNHNKIWQKCFDNAKREANYQKEISGNLIDIEDIYYMADECFKEKTGIDLNTLELDEITVNKPTQSGDKEINDLIQDMIIDTISGEIHNLYDRTDYYYMAGFLDDVAYYDVFKPFIIEQMILNNYEVFKNGEEILVTYNNKNIITDKDIEEYISNNPELEKYLKTTLVKFYIENIDYNLLFSKIRQELKNYTDNDDIYIFLKSKSKNDQKYYIAQTIESTDELWALDDIIYDQNIISPEDFLEKEFKKISSPINEIRVNQPIREKFPIEITRENYDYVAEFLEKKGYKWRDDVNKLPTEFNPFLHSISRVRNANKLYIHVLPGKRIYTKLSTNEIKVNIPNKLKIIKKDSQWALLVDNKYIFSNMYSNWYNDPKFKNFHIIDCHIDVDYDENDIENLEISIPEPSFGGGGSEADIQNAYASYDEDITIAQQVLTPYSTKSDFDSYRIPLDIIPYSNLIPTLDEIKVNKPSRFEALKRNLIKLIENDIKNYGYNDFFKEIANETIEDLQNATTEEKLREIIYHYVLGEKSSVQRYFDLATYKEKDNNPLLNEIKVLQPGFNFNNLKIIVGLSKIETDIFRADEYMELVDLGIYYTFIPSGGQPFVVLIPKQYIELTDMTGYYKEIRQEFMNKIKDLISQNKILKATPVNTNESNNSNKTKQQTFKEVFLSSYKKEVDILIEEYLEKHQLNEYPESKILTILNKWGIDPKKDIEKTKIARNLIKRFEEIKNSLTQKLDILVIPDEIKNKDIKNIDLYSFESLQKLINSYPENLDKVKKDAVKQFVEKEQIDRATAQSYVARFIDNRKKLKFGTKEGLEDEGFTKEEVLNYIPKRLQQQDAFFDPRNWDWASFEQMLDAIFPSQKQAGEEGENLASTDADKIYDKNGIEIYKGDDVRKCIEYNPKSDTTGRKKYGWCVTQAGNTNYDFYRFGGGKLQSPTFYFVFDRSKPSSPEHAIFDDQWHAFVIQVEFDQSKYVVTGANNRGDILTDEGKGWEGIANIVPADTWNKIKGLKDYFKPIKLSAVERARKFASGKNLSVDEFKELSEDEKILYIQGKASKNQIPPDTLKILPQYKINLEGRSTTLANIAMDAGQKFPYSALKDNEALAKRYAVVSSRYYPNDPLPLPFIKYLDEDAKEKYLVKYDNNLTFEYIVKYFGDKVAEKYVEENVKKLKFLPPTAAKYIKNQKLKQLFQIYSKLFDTWQYTSGTNMSDEELENASAMPQQAVNPVPITPKEWNKLSSQEKKVIIRLAEKYNSNDDFNELLYAVPFVIKDKDKRYVLLPKSNDGFSYDSWVMIDEQGKVIKDNISGYSILGDDELFGGSLNIDPDSPNYMQRVFDIDDLKIDD